MAWTDRKLCGSRQHYSKSEELSLVEGQILLAEAIAACAWTVVYTLLLVGWGQEKDSLLSH